jgi:hypothetical protein
MTFQDIVDNAKARAIDFGATFPTTARVLFRRIEIRQQEIFSAASRVNPDYFGVSASGVVDPVTLSADLKDMEAAVDVDPASQVSRVEVQDPGTHPTLVAGDEINVVSLHDIAAALAPRMTLRNFVLTSVGQEVAGVATVLVFYGYRPENKTTPLDGTEPAELPDVYQELLVIDLVKWMLKQTVELAPETKAPALAVLSEEEEEMQGAFMAEVTDYGGAQVSRFGDVRGSQRF